MLERIQKIQNIGTFENCQPSRIQLSNLVYLYGPNSKGKTTFCDIFKSIMLNDPSYISKRKTVGKKEKQCITLNCGNKNIVEYKNDNWTYNSNIPELQNIQVFDTEFVHKNVFTNAQIVRQNQENFTQFIIGDESIQLSKQLQELQLEKTQLKKKKEEVEENIRKEIGEKIDLESFIKLKYQADINYEDTLCLGIQTNIQQYKENKKNIDDIKKLKIPSTLSPIDCKFLNTYEQINTILLSTIQFDKESLLEKYNNHKNACIKNEYHQDIDSWILKGLDLKKNNQCPFCGSTLENNNLIESYLELFSNEVKQYNKNINYLNKISIYDKIPISYDNFYNFDNILYNINNKLSHYISQDIFNDIIKSKEELKTDIDEANNFLKDLNSVVQQKIEQKNQNMYNSISKLDLENLTNALNKINTKINQLNVLIYDYSSNATEYINNLSTDQIDKNILELETEYNQYSIIILRNKLNDLVQDIKEKNNRMTIITKEVKTKKEEFAHTQESYLKEFFDDINYYFNQFGSRNYKIEKFESNRGTNKTYSLDLKFKNNSVSPEQIPFVLSESDRRALALAIFFSKLKKIANSHTIIVLDDPITSFDLERMNVFINTLQEFKGKVAQIIVTTHYQTFFKKLVNLTHNDKPTLIKIISNPNSNDFISIVKDKESLLMDEYQAELYKMTSFMKGLSNNYNTVDARTILQKYLEYHFAFELMEEEYKNLDELLTLLKDKNHINDDLYEKLKNKKNEYNTAAHQFDNDTEEQKRNSIFELYDLLQKI